MELKKGSIVLIEAPRDHKGTEIKKKRPAIVVSPLEMAQHANRVIVVPLTSNVSKLYPFEALIHSSAKPSKACCDQILTISTERIIETQGFISSEELKALNRALKVILEL